MILNISNLQTSPYGCFVPKLEDGTVLSWEPIWIYNLWLEWCLWPSCQWRYRVMEGWNVSLPENCSNCSSYRAKISLQHHPLCHESLSTNEELRKLLLLLSMSISSLPTMLSFFFFKKSKSLPNYMLFYNIQRRRRGKKNWQQIHNTFLNRPKICKYQNKHLGTL